MYHFPSSYYITLENDLHYVLFSITAFFCSWLFLAWCAIFHHYVICPRMVCNFPTLTYFDLDNYLHCMPLSIINLLCPLDDDFQCVPLSIIAFLWPWQWYAWCAIFHRWLYSPWQLLAWCAIFHHLVTSPMTIVCMVSHFPAYTYFAHDNGLHGEPFSSMNCIALDNGLHEEPFSIIELHRSWQWFGWHAIFHHFPTLSLICMEHHFPSLTYLLCSWQWFSWSTIFHHWLTLPLSQVWGFNKDEGVTFCRHNL